jgi:hypothetical protein
MNIVPWKRFQIVFSIIAAVSIVASCATSPEARTDPVVSPPATPPLEPAPPVAVVPVEVKDPVVAPVPFDPATISVELKQTTFVDVRELILNLNSIIQAKNFDAWSKALTQDYLEHYSSSETLAKLSESSVLKRQGLALRSLEDYFKYVVYPSRQNDRVDDIEFIEPAKIKAILINPKGERLVLYNLEKIGDTWKIAIWR